MARERLEEGTRGFQRKETILDYKVLETEDHSSNDFNLMLMTEAKDLASIEANQEKFDAVAQQVSGSDEQQRQGYGNREAMRDPLATRIVREFVVSPRQWVRGIFRNRFSRYPVAIWMAVFFY
jgi:hypothetical protein